LPEIAWDAGNKGIDKINLKTIDQLMRNTFFLNGSKSKKSSFFIFF